MPTTSAQMIVARSWIGTSEEDDVFNERYDRLGPQVGWSKALDAAIEESLRAQLAVMELDNPTSITVGDISLSFGQNIIALQTTLKDFMSKGGTSGRAVVSRFVRCDPTR